MKIIGLIGAKFGTSAKAMMHLFQQIMEKQYPESQLEVIDLADYELVFSDGRNYMDYEGDTKNVLEKIMSADALVISTPIYQASIPGVLKNVFDLLPEEAFLNKVVGIMSVAASDKHFLVAEQQLKPILNFMKAQIIPSVVFATKKEIVNGEIKSSDIVTRVNQMAMELTERVQACKSVQEARDNQFDF